MNTLIKNRSAALKLVFLTAMLIILVSCGGGGGGGDNVLSNPVLPSGDFLTPTLTVADTSPNVGDTFDVTITVPSALDLYQADLEIDYDHSVIELVSSPAGSVTVGDIFPLQDAKYLDFVSTNNVIYNFYGAGSYTGTSGTLCTITFIAVASGTTTINFSPSGSNTGSVYFYEVTGETDPNISSVTITVP